PQSSAVYCQIRRVNNQGRGLAARLPFFFRVFLRATSCSPRADRRTIDIPHIPIKLVSIVQCHQQGMSNDDQSSVATPTVEAVVYRLPRTVTLRHISPRCAGAQTPEHPVENTPVVFPLAASLTVGGQQWLYSLKLFVRDFMSSRHPCLLVTNFVK